MVGWGAADGVVSPHSGDVCEGGRVAMAQRGFKRLAEGGKGIWKQATLPEDPGWVIWSCWTAGYKPGLLPCARSKPATPRHRGVLFGMGPLRPTVAGSLRLES